VPATLTGRTVVIRIGFDDRLTVYDGDRVVATHRLQSATRGRVTVPEHHAALWQETLRVERRPLQTYREVVQWR